MVYYRLIINLDKSYEKCGKRCADQHSLRADAWAKSSFWRCFNLIPVLKF